MKVFILIISTLLPGLLHAQQVYTVGSQTADFQVKKVLNYSAASTSFGQLKEKLLILDFFGTWCAPCVKSLPHLESLKETFKDELNVVLVSEEAQNKLESFISKRPGFKLPVIVDEEKRFVKLFQPPSYPYTVVIGKNNRVLAITTQQELTPVNINKWLKEQETDAGSPPTGNSTVKDTMETDIVISQTNSNNKLVALSQRLVYMAKTGENITELADEFSKISAEELKSVLRSDEEKKAFWINVYNAFTQISLQKHPEQFKKRKAFFSNRNIGIAGKEFSLDDIEHDILRRSKIKWSLGYLNKLFPGKTEKQLRVNKLDYRLHFALNCGAKSCPPIAFYQSENLDQQLNIATKSYLTSEGEYDAANNTVRLPAIMGWFRKDFGGKKKMIKLLKQLSIIPVDKNPRVRFKKYDWSLYLQNYKS